MNPLLKGCVKPLEFSDYEESRGKMIRGQTTRHLNSDEIPRGHPKENRIRRVLNLPN